ncbi:MAG: hypothetical protein R3D25_03265 [Geminicoccaceae bacterium]
MAEALADGPSSRLRGKMRFLASWFLAAGLAIGGAAIVPIPSLDGAAWAQTIAVGEGARVLGSSDTRINVRAAPRVASGVIVASTRGVAGSCLEQVREAACEGQYTWYRVTTLPGSAEAFGGWIRATS